MDEASERTLRKQLEKERKFLKRARLLKIAQAFIEDSENRIKRYERRLDETG